MTEFWYIAAFALAAALLLIAGLWVWDERRQERKRADREAFKEFMSGKWRAEWASLDPARQARGTEAVARQLRHVASRIDDPPGRVPDHQMAGLLSAQRRDEGGS